MSNFSFNETEEVDMPKVMIFGTFDGLHKGHIFFIERAMEYGDKLIIVVARDKTVKKLKGRKPKFSEKERVENIKKKKFGAKIVLGQLKNKYKIIEHYDPDIICLGYDQKFFTENLKEELSKRGLKTEIVRLKAYKPEIYKSSKIFK